MCKHTTYKIKNRKTEKQVAHLLCLHETKVRVARQAGW